MRGLAADIFRILRQLDGEACPRADGIPTGLRWFNGHVDPTLDVRAKQSRVENLWSQELSRRLSNDRRHGDDQVRYPGTRKKCDVVLTSLANEQRWMVVKGAWTEYAYPSDTIYPLITKTNSAFRKYLGAAADDILKLERFAPVEATHLAFLLIGFDRALRSITPSDIDKIRSVMTGGAWREWTDAWDEASTGWQGCRIRCWLWLREKSKSATDAFTAEGGTAC
jgi:hypothetical protein